MGPFSTAQRSQRSQSAAHETAVSTETQNNTDYICELRRLCPQKYVSQMHIYSTPSPTKRLPAYHFLRLCHTLPQSTSNSLPNYDLIGTWPNGIDARSFHGAEAERPHRSAFSISGHSRHFNFVGQTWISARFASHFLCSHCLLKSLATLSRSAPSKFSNP